MKLAASLTLLLSVFAARGLEACSVPVFRYALERWPADPYRILVVGPEGDVSKQTADAIRAAIADEDHPLNAVVERATADGELAPGLAALRTLDRHATEADEPTADGGALTGDVRLVVGYPRVSRAPSPLAWSGPASAEALARALNSPLRREIGQRLVRGETAVWVFLPSGRKDDDAKARKTLEDNLAKLTKELELPEISDQDLALVGLDAEARSSIQISFSTVTLDRSDPKESVFLEMLLGIEPDLRPAEGEPIPPMAIPVFGRGRALYALLGAGINEFTIRDACEFLVGPCSCQVKQENPGVDLLLRVPWDRDVQTDSIGDRPPPELVGFDPGHLAANVETTAPAEEWDGTILGAEGDAGGESETGLSSGDDASDTTPIVERSERNPSASAGSDVDASVTGSGVTGSGVTGSGVTGSGVTGSGVTGSGVTGSAQSIPAPNATDDPTAPVEGASSDSGVGPSPSALANRIWSRSILAVVAAIVAIGAAAWFLVPRSSDRS